MSAQEFETVLARLYVDEDFRRLFLVQPETACNGFQLTGEERADLMAVDRAGLVMASRSYRLKRMGRGKPGWVARILRKAGALLNRPSHRA